MRHALIRLWRMVGLEVKWSVECALLPVHSTCDKTHLVVGSFPKAIPPYSISPSARSTTSSKESHRKVCR